MSYLCGMKHRIAHIVLMLLTVCNLAAQTTISGVVTDGREPLTSANIFILGTIDGCNEVVVTASTFSFGKSDNFKTMDALDVVMAGNSCGDIVAALQTLPGTQKVGENGKLYVRGGDSDECQTFVNGMHVLVPYSTNTENTAVRGRFSPFLFKGINFSLGGYGGEYGQRYYIDVMENFEKALKLNPDNQLAKQLQQKFYEGMKQQTDNLK